MEVREQEKTRKNGKELERTKYNRKAQKIFSHVF
jgi:hypothetical protein